MTRPTSWITVFRGSHSRPEEALAMSGFVGNLAELARRNDAFRRVLYTAPNSQLVVMCLGPSEDIGLERHDRLDQVFHVVDGRGTAVIEGVSYRIGEGSIVVVPAGHEHNIINGASDRPLRVATVYSPPAHRDLVVHGTKAEAEADEADQPGELATTAGRSS